MKTTGILYIHGDRKHSANRFLSKEELKGIFNPHSDSLKAMVEMKITYVVKRYKAHKPKEGRRVRSKKAKKQKFMKPGYPKYKTKSRMLYI